MSEMFSLKQPISVQHGSSIYQVEDANGRYDPKSHLAEMIALLGPPPKEVIE